MCSETLCSPSTSLPPDHPLGPLGMEREGVQLGNVLCGVDCGARPRAQPERGSHPGVGTRGWGRGTQIKGTCHGWRRDKQETNRKRSMGVGKVRQESPVFLCGLGLSPRMGKGVVSYINYLLLQGKDSTIQWLKTINNIYFVSPVLTASEVTQHHSALTAGLSRFKGKKTYTRPAKGGMSTS